MNEKIMEKAGFAQEVKAVKEGKCPFCGQPVKISDFRDALSLKEYKISGLCQKCQDKVFGA